MNYNWKMYDRNLTGFVLKNKNIYQQDSKISSESIWKHGTNTWTIKFPSPTQKALAGANNFFNAIFWRDTDTCQGVSSCTLHLHFILMVLENVRPRHIRILPR